MTYPPVGYVINRWYKEKSYESRSFFHSYKKAEEYCKKLNELNKHKEIFYETSEIDILD